MDFGSQETVATIKAENECMEMNEEVDEETKGPVRSETQAIQTVFDSNQRLKADVWKEFVSVGVGEDGKKRGRCIHCSRNFIIERLYGTSHLRRHLQSCPKKPENKSGGNDEQDRHKRNSTDAKGASVSESSCDREGVSNNVSNKRQRSSTSEGKTRSAMLLGLDILDCPICFDALTIPIFQCDNGHLACSSCYPKLSNKCPTCDSPVGQNRCRAMEQLDFGSQEIIATIKAENECMEINEEVDEETKRPVRSDTQAIQTVFDSNQRLKAVWKEYVVGVGEDGNDEQDRHKHNSTDVKGGASVSESSCDKEEVSNNVSKKRQRSSTSEGKTRSAMLLGLDILDCPICFDALTIPIFQCDHGHLACSSCCPKLSNKCPTCDSPVGHNRCRAMESVLESVFVPCRNAKFGCTKNVSYGKESTHEKECSFSQCACPALDCNYTGSYNDIYTHFVDNHCHESKSMSFGCGGSVDVQMNIATDKILVLWESKKRLLLTLQCFNEPHGLYATVRCIAPSAPELGKLAYCLYYSMDGHTLTYKSPEVKMVLELSSETPQDNFMFVPHSLLRGESLKMKISIVLEDED